MNDRAVAIARRVAGDLLVPLRLRLRTAVRRAVLTALDDSTGLASAQVTLTADDPADRVEVLTPHGFTSAPRVGAEAIVLAVNGNPQHLVAITFDRRHRLTALADGEAAMSIGEVGQVIHLKADGSILITPKAGKKVTIGAGTAQPLAQNDDVKDILSDISTALGVITAAWAAAPGMVYATDSVPLKSAYSTAATTLATAAGKIAALLGCLEAEGA